MLEAIYDMLDTANRQVNINPATHDNYNRPYGVPKSTLKRSNAFRERNAPSSVKEARDILKATTNARKTFSNDEKTLFK